MCQQAKECHQLLATQEARRGMDRFSSRVFGIVSLWYRNPPLPPLFKSLFHQGWCTGKTQRDGMEREAGGGIGMGNTCKSMADSCQCMAKNHYNVVISLQLIKINGEKNTTECRAQNINQNTHTQNKSLSHTSLSWKTYISTCFHQGKEIWRGFSLSQKNGKIENSTEALFCGEGL